MAERIEQGGTVLRPQLIHSLFTAEQDGLHPVRRGADRHGAAASAGSPAHASAVRELTTQFPSPSITAQANAIVAPGKGILAADESSGTIKKRFDAIGVESTETSRRDYRELMFRTPAMKEFISGVILYDETIWQDAADGTPLVSRKDSPAPARAPAGSSASRGRCVVLQA